MDTVGTDGVSISSSHNAATCKSFTLNFYIKRTRVLCDIRKDALGREL